MALVTFVAGNVLEAAELNDSFDFVNRVTDLDFIGTLQGTSSLTYVDLATVGPSVTLTTGTDALVIFGAEYDDDGNLSNNGFVSLAVSGATTIAASDTWAAFGAEGFGGGLKVNLNIGYKFTTLTPGSNTFTLKYKKSGGSSTSSFSKRYLLVIRP